MSLLTGVATHAADINEIMVGYYLNGGKWFDRDAEKQYKEKKKKVNSELHDAQVARAKVMAEKFIAWSRTKGYTQVKQVYWTARPGSLQSAVDPSGRIEISPKENPTDILVRFARGPANGLLGVSAKATGTRQDIGFKNPGLGTIEQLLGLKLNGILQSYIDKAIKLYGLSESAGIRKQEIRKNKKVQEKTQELGTKAMHDVVEEILKKMKRMRPEELRKYILTAWMNAGKVYPPYVKVTGFGAKEPYSAKVEDPLANDKLAAINKGNIRLDKEGNATILVSANGRHIMKMRAKFESEKLASAFKFSGDPWS